SMACCSEPAVVHLENPREGAEVTGDHWYNPDRQGLLDLGYKPTTDIINEVGELTRDLMRPKIRRRIEAHAYALVPDVHWDGRRELAEERK
ncbi:hypothetical protein, partial [Thioalkalivibrio sp.]|uniref:hypothetical protein n=1 Tax=Thioalkalivibrio sp. TaxID=2093813 RepID=UPI003975AC17